MCKEAKKAFRMIVKPSPFHYLVTNKGGANWRGALNTVNMVTHEKAQNGRHGPQQMKRK